MNNLECACYSHGYYEPNGKYFNYEPITAASLTKKALLTKKKDMGLCMSCGDGHGSYEQIKNFLLDDKGVYTWHHKPGSGFDFKDVSKGRKKESETMFLSIFRLQTSNYIP